IAAEVIAESLPDAAVRRALGEIPAARGRTIVVSVGKAGWQMAKAASEMLRGAFDAGYVITKYDHSKGDLESYGVFEAGHPQMDQNSPDATQAVLDAVSGLTEDDRVLLLLSGGGSALFEKPLIPLEELRDINAQLLAC